MNTDRPTDRQIHVFFRPRITKRFSMCLITESKLIYQKFSLSICQNLPVIWLMMRHTLWSNPFFVQPLIYRCWLFWHTQPDKIIPNKHTLDHIRSILSHSNDWLLLTLSANSFSVWKISYFCVTFGGVYLPIFKIILKKCKEIQSIKTNRFDISIAIKFRRNKHNFQNANFVLWKSVD